MVDPVEHYYRIFLRQKLHRNNQEGGSNSSSGPDGIKTDRIFRGDAIVYPNYQQGYGIGNVLGSFFRRMFRVYGPIGFKTLLNFGNKVAADRQAAPDAPIGETLRKRGKEALLEGANQVLSKLQEGGRQSKRK